MTLELIAETINPLREIAIELSIGTLLPLKFPLKFLPKKGGVVSTLPEGVCSIFSGVIFAARTSFAAFFNISNCFVGIEEV